MQPGAFVAHDRRVAAAIVPDVRDFFPPLR
jgi:hypothetical protein